MMSCLIDPSESRRMESVLSPIASSSPSICSNAVNLSQICSPLAAGVVKRRRSASDWALKGQWHAARALIGWSQSDLAEKVGVAP
jgi:hypothetical protein